MKKIFILLISIFLLSGCTNYTELQDLGVVSSIRIDYKDNYELTLEIYKKDKVELIKTKGSTIEEAINKSSTKTGKNIYLNHLNAIFLTENVKINELIYYFIRNPNVNTNFYLLLDKSNELYSESENKGESIKKALKRINEETFFDITRNYLNKMSDIVIPTYDGNITKKAIFKDNKYYDEINSELSNTLDLIKNKKSMDLKIKCDNDYFEVSLDNINTNYKVKKDITINNKIEASLKSYYCKYDLTDKNNIKKLENKAINKFNKNIDNLITYLKDNEIDLLGLNRKKINYSHNLSDVYYSDLININTKIEINKKGLLLK